MKHIEYLTLRYDDFAKAVRLLKESDDSTWKTANDRERVRLILMKAQVHATLALVDAVDKVAAGRASAANDR